MQHKFFRVVFRVLCIYFIISCLRPNVLSQIGGRKIYGTLTVPEINGCRDAWEWMMGLDLFGALGVDYKEEYLEEDIVSLDIWFVNKTDDVSINTVIMLSESDGVEMIIGVDYDDKKAELTYKPVYILQEDSDNVGEYKEYIRYEDEESINEFLDKYGITRKDIKKYQNYMIYDVVVKTWSRAHWELYWLESMKLSMCKVVDNTFQFEEK